jgi:hypothetical protein
MILEIYNIEEFDIQTYFASQWSRLRKVGSVPDFSHRDASSPEE